MTQHDNQFANRFVVSGIDRVLTVQRPAVLAHLHSIRAHNPDATPHDVIRILERRYLTAVTTGGALVGASAVIPAVGVGASLALSTVETGGFLEASALFALDGGHLEPTGSYPTRTSKFEAAGFDPARVLAS